MVSNTDSYRESSLSDNTPHPRTRHDSSALLTLPTPLSVSRPTVSTTSTGFSRSTEDSFYSEGASSHAHLIPSPVPDATYDSPASPSPRYPSPGGGAILRQQTMPNAYPGETHNPFHSSEAQVASGYDSHGHSPIAEPDESLLPRARSPMSSSSHGQARPPSRGVTLSDNGPVPNAEAVRRVPRGTKRSSTISPTTATPNTNRYSRQGSNQLGLPPGAAAPQASGGPSYY